MDGSTNGVVGRGAGLVFPELQMCRAPVSSDQARAKPTLVTAEWRWLVMLNYSIDPGTLKSFIPAGTELDSWSGRTLISVVGFRFLKTRIRGLPVLYHQDFEEINLRFYVRRRVEDGWRRGVVFIREVVSRRLIALMARWLYNENYVVCPTTSRLVQPTDSKVGRVEYGWNCRGEPIKIQAAYGDTPQCPSVGSEEEFITEHYWGYSTQRDGSCLEYQVEHPKWTVWRASQALLVGDVTSFCGPELGAALSAKPSSAFVSNGSEVAVRQGAKLPAATELVTTHVREQEEDRT